MDRRSAQPHDLGRQAEHEMVQERYCGRAEAKFICGWPTQVITRLSWQLLALCTMQVRVMRFAQQLEVARLACLPPAAGTPQPHLRLGVVRGLCKGEH